MVFSLDDDTNALESALCVMEKWDVDVFALFDLEDTAHDVVTCRESQPTRKKARKPYNDRRDTRKAQKTELLNEIEFLERVLEGFKQQAGCLESRTLEEDALRLECEGLAGRQRMLRVQSEIENTKLRSLFDAQRKSAYKIAMLTRKVDAIELALGKVRSAAMAKYDGPNLDVGIQLMELDALTEEAAVIFSSEVFTQHASSEFRDIQFHPCGPESVEVEFVMSWLLPFSVAKVSTALWIQTTRMCRTNKSSDFEDLYSASGVLVSQFVVEPRIPGSFGNASDQPKGGPSHGQIASKLREESDGSVLLVSTFQSKIFNPHGETKGFMSGDGLLRVERVSDRVSRVKWCRRVRGSPPEHATQTDLARLRWYEELMKGPTRQFWKKNLESNVQEVENLLLTPSFYA